jgi:hypothetical protein
MAVTTLMSSSRNCYAIRKKIIKVLELIEHIFFSDMDVAECERKRFEFIDDLTDLEKQFAILREQ